MRECVFIYSYSALHYLSSNPTLVLNMSSIAVSWSPPTQATPDSYTVSHSCQFLCGSSQTGSDPATVTGATDYTINPIPPNSRCNVSVTAVFNGNENSNTVSSSTTTSTAGIY